MAKYIDADALLKESIRIEGSFDLPSGKSQDFSAITVTTIQNFPAADVAPVVHGKWIDKTIWFGALGVLYIQCSNCGQVTQRVAESLGDGLGDKYCGNCGAKMDLEVAE